jgi:putative copper resistance protein D
MTAVSEAPLILIRAVHIAAVMLAFGAGVFAALVWQRPSVAIAAAMPRGELRAWLLRLAIGSLIVALVTWLLWLGAVAQGMSGLPLGQAVAPGVLGTVVRRTQFGHLWLARLVLAAAVLVIVLLIERRTATPRTNPIRNPLLMIGFAALLMSIAGAGHAVATQGSQDWLHLGADALHLLAAGAWFGALIPLAWALNRGRCEGSAEWLDIAALATENFSAMGVIAMAVIVATGATNAWFLVGGLHALGTTVYGRLLSVKLLLLAAILVLAVINRNVLRPRLLAHSDPIAAMRSLRRNAVAEVILGGAILLIVGALGVTMPAVGAAAAGGSAMMME